MFLEELNGIICENGLNFRLPCISNIFKHFPGAWSLHRPQLTLPSFKITQTTFSGILESLLHASQLQSLLFTIS